MFNMKPLVFGLLSSALILPALSHAADKPATPPKKIEAEIIITNPKALQEAVLGPSDNSGDQTTVERINPLPDEEAPESAPGKPLNTEDTGTPGHKNIEFNVIGNCDRTHDGSHCESEMEIAVGIRENIELSFAKSIVRETAVGEPTFRGAGPSEIGIKYRFYDKKGLSMAVAPTYTFNDATRHRDEDGNKLPGEGDSIYIPLVISKESGSFTTTANVGFGRNLQTRENSYVISGAVGYAINDRNRIMGEVYSERDFRMRNKETDVNVAYVRVAKSSWLADHNLEASFVAKVGHSIGHTQDGLQHSYVSIGVSFFRKH